MLPVNPVRAGRQNRVVILEAVQRAEAISRSMLVGITGLTPATITNAVRELVELRLMLETGRPAPRQESRAGAPSFLLELDGTYHRVLAVHQGVSRIRLGLHGIAGGVLAMRELPVLPGEPAPATVERIANGLRELCAREHVSDERVRGIGVGAVGLVEPDTGRVRAAPNLGWADVPLGEWLSDASGWPAVVRNNVHGMAAGELRFTGIPEGHAIYVYVGTGIGAGIVVGGKVLDGAHGAAGEIGHLVVPGGGPCSCGKVGCLETVAAEPAIARRAAGLVDTASGPDGSKRAVERLVRLAAGGDARARSALVEVARALGKALAQAVEIVDPGAVILGGVIAEAGELVLAPLATELSRSAFAVRGRHVNVREGANRRVAGLIGAATLALDEFVFNPDADVFADRQIGTVSHGRR